MAARKGGSRDRLLNAAEELFAERGYDATTTREIAARAGDGLGTLSYHFTTKEDLVFEVVYRRWDELADIRRSMYLAAAEKRGGVPTLDEAISSIVTPFIERALNGGQAWASYTRLLSRLAYVTTGNMPRLLSEQTDPFAKELMGWLSAAAPEASETDVGYGYQFIIGCMLDTVKQGEHDRIGRLTNGVCSSSNYDEVSQRLLVFVTTGFRGVLGMANPLET